MKRICLIIHSIGVGGMERVMHQLAVNFSKRRGVRLDLILIGKKREVVYPLPESVNIHIPKFVFNNNRRVIDTFRTIYFLRKTVKEIDPDTILSFGEYWNNLVLLSLMGLRYPVFISDRSEPAKDLGRIQNFLRNPLYQKAAGYIAQTQKAKEICISNEWNRNIKVIGNPIRKIHPDNKIDKENIVLTVGRLIKTKHVDHLIRIFAELNIDDWKLVIVGGDAKGLNLSRDLRKLIQRLGAKQSVQLEGEQKEIEKYYNKSKIFAFTSSSEGFPNVIGEAMSAGIPVVAYDCTAGPSDLIDDGINGYLVPLFDQKQFGQKLSKLMSDNALREKLGKKARNKVLEYDSDKISEQFYRFITNNEAEVKESQTAYKGS